MVYTTGYEGAVVVLITCKMTVPGAVCLSPSALGSSEDIQRRCETGRPAGGAAGAGRPPHSAASRWRRWDWPCLSAAGSAEPADSEQGECLPSSLTSVFLHWTGEILTWRQPKFPRLRYSRWEVVESRSSFSLWGRGGRQHVTNLCSWVQLDSFQLSLPVNHCVSVRP